MSIEILTRAEGEKLVIEVSRDTLRANVALLESLIDRMLERSNVLDDSDKLVRKFENMLEQFQDDLKLWEQTVEAAPEKSDWYYNAPNNFPHDHLPEGSS